MALAFQLALASIAMFLCATQVLAKPGAKYNEEFRARGPCAAETGVDERFRSRVSPIPEDDPKFRKYILCMCKTFGFIDADDKIHKDTIEEWIKQEMGLSRTQTVKFMDECFVEGTTPTDTALIILKCFDKVKLYYRQLNQIVP